MRYLKAHFNCTLQGCRLCPQALLLLMAAALLLQTASAKVTVAGKLECPFKSISVKSGTDLYSIVKHPDRTYFLAAGSYTVSDTITLETLPDHPAIYCIIGRGEEPNAVHLKVTGTTPRSPAFRLHAFVHLGLKNLELDGNGTYSGLHIQGSGTAAVEDVNLFNLRGYNLGGAVKINNTNSVSGLQAKADFVNVHLMDNTATKFGGAVGCIGRGRLSFYNTSFIGNQALGGRGGAVALYQNCSVTISGTTTFDHNSAGKQGVGGALYLEGVGYASDSWIFSTHKFPRTPSITLKDRLCAQHNVAGVGGGFATLVGHSQMQIHNSELITVANNGVSTVSIKSAVVFGATPRLSCGWSSIDKRGWAAGNYEVTGPICSCTRDFTYGNSTKCHSCANGFDSVMCRCKRRKPRSTTKEDCTSSHCACPSSKTDDNPHQTPSDGANLSDSHSRGMQVGAALIGGLMFNTIIRPVVNHLLSELQSTAVEAVYNATVGFLPVVKTTSFW